MLDNDARGVSNRHRMVSRRTESPARCHDIVFANTSRILRSTHLLEASSVS
jgi:hypothetical protein